MAVGMNTKPVPNTKPQDTTWYNKVSCLQLVLFGAVAAILALNVLQAVFDPEEVLLRFRILIDMNWDGLRLYAVIGEFFGEAFVGALAGWWACWRRRKKQRDS